jgi:hypothetical protein
VAEAKYGQWVVARRPKWSGLALSRLFAAGPVGGAVIKPLTPPAGCASMGQASAVGLPSVLHRAWVLANNAG